MPMEQRDGFAVGRAQRWRPAMVPAVATGLLLMERALLDRMGSPVTLLRALGDLGQAWTDPVAAVLAVMALMAETLVGYVLVVLVLGSMGTLPGSMGRLTARLTSLITPVAVLRLLDLLVGSALLAQTALAVPPGTPHEHRWTASYPGATASSPFSGSVGSTAMRDPTTTGLGPGWLDRPVDEPEPVGARPDPRRSAAPLPPWLGGGPSNAAPELRDEAGGTTVASHVVEVGDTLWDIAAARLVPAERLAANINRYWRQVYRANRSAIGGDPDLLHPGTRLQVPPFRRAR
jgi:LysM domain